MEDRARGGVRRVQVLYPFDRSTNPACSVHTAHRIFLHRIFVPNAPSPGKNVDLAEHGSSVDGTHVILWSPWSGINQTWRFEEA